MKTNRSPLSELENLSAYLDDQLQPIEAEELRQRLAQESELRRQLEDLRRTRYILRRTPKVKRLRNFVLSPEDIRRQRFAAQAMNFSRLISAAASVLLLVMIGTQFLLGGGLMAGAPAENFSLMVDEAADDLGAEEPAAETMMLESVPMEEAAEEDSADDSIDAALVAEETEMPAAEEAEMLDDAPTQTPELDGAGGGPPVEGEPPAPEATSEAEFSPDERSMPTEKDTSTEGGVGESGLTGEEVQSQDEVFATEPAEPTLVISLSPARIVQAVLLLLAVAGALMAAYYRKQVR
jgi:hypothetical protein